MNSYYTPLKREYILYVVLLLLLATAYLTHLGFTPLDNDTDEGRRALVAAEMMISGDYLTPTLRGEIYLNKPPLYNWAIVLSYRIFGNYSTFALRFPVIVSTFIFGFVIFSYVRKFTSDFRVAFFSAFAFMTNGRILIYDSLQGLIDITFGWVTFLTIMIIYDYGKKEKYYPLFILGYLLTAAGFMMKGLPGLVCLGITLMVFFIYSRKFKMLFSLAHLSGVVVFISALALYYIPFFLQNDIDVSAVFGRLLNESVKRTVADQGVSNMLTHLVTFPFEILYHFAPWTLLIVLLFNRENRTLVKNHDFIFFNVLAFLANIVIYWTSPEVYARYLFMLMPLFFNVLIYTYFHSPVLFKLPRRLTDIVFMSAIAIAAVIIWLVPLLNIIEVNARLWITCALASIVFASIFMLSLKYKQYKLLLFCFGICVCRICFNLLAVENRGARSRAIEKAGARVAALTSDKPLYILKNTNFTDRYDGLTFHIVTRRKKLLTYSEPNNLNAVYIADDERLRNSKYTLLLDLAPLDFPGMKVVQLIKK